MNILLKAATVIDPSSPFHHKKVDILIEEGKIASIDDTIDHVDSIKVELEDLHVSQGWFDSSVNFGEPGYEERETIANGLSVAAKSGFTAIALQPNTLPITDNSTGVGFLKSKSTLVDIYPLGALTLGSKGIDLAELYDMKQAGAIGFGDYKKSIQNPNLLKIALLYAQNFDGLVQSFPQDNHIAGKGMVHEGVKSTQLGLKSIPALAEALQIARDLYILEYTGGKLHIPTVSTKSAVDLIRQAKSKGLQVSCSTSVHHISLTDQILDSFDANYKVMPPLRPQNDVDALRKAVEDGTIDMVTSDHRPIDIEHKKVAFTQAKYGTIGLESAFGTLNTILGIELTVKMLTAGKAIFGIEQHPIVQGQKAELSLFSGKGINTFSKEQINSTSKNSAMIGIKTLGKPYGIIANNQYVIPDL